MPTDETTYPLDADDAPDDDFDTWDSPGGDPRSRTVLLVIGAIVVIAVVALVLTRGGSDDDGAKDSGGSTTTTATPAKSNDWSKAVTGRPAALGKQGAPITAVTPGAKPGAYLWTDFNGWHLWIVKGEGVGALSGRITSNDKPTKAKLLVADSGSAELKDYAINFTFSGTAPVTGIDFNPGFYAERMVLELNTETGPLDVKLIRTGAGSNTPKFPLYLNKGA